MSDEADRLDEEAAALRAYAEDLMNRSHELIQLAKTLAAEAERRRHLPKETLG